MPIFKLQCPDGVVQEIQYDETTDKNAIVEGILAEWREYCERNWLTKDHEDKQSGERKVKRFMDGLSAFLLLEESDADIVNARSERRNRQSEVLIPSVNGGYVKGVSFQVVEQMHSANSVFQSGKINARKPVEHPADNMFTRLGQVTKEYGLRNMTLHIVDTDNMFSYKGERYQVDYQGYNGKRTKSGMRYDMDRIMVSVDKDDQLFFLDQFGRVIPQIQVTKVVDENIDKINCKEIPAPAEELQQAS